jgi:TolB-like protein/class 3 adenylate cyclase/cytochrome c-type biogenesis protein CcmH/NrfG
MSEANRRLAGILAADVVGYSAMVGKDEPATLARVRSLRTDLIEPLAAEHGGRLFKTTGDGFLAAFASAVQALRCAIAIQERLNSDPDGLRLRIGVHQGEVVAEGDDLLGDGVIIAARLEPLAESGGICISGRVREDAAGKLDLAFIDLGDQQLKNIARPIRVYAINFTATWPANLPALRRLSIVVLPFANLSHDPEQEYFADGITEDLTTDLSRISEMVVISRNTAFTYRKKTVDTRQIGRELSVRYALEGSVRRLGNQIRVNAQLIDAQTDTHLWAERFDGAVEDLFALQDEVTRRIARALNVELAAAEAARPIEHLDALDCILRGRAIMAKPLSAAGVDEAIGWYERALTIDPASSEAQAHLASTLAGRVTDFVPESSDADLERAEKLARQAVMSSPRNARMHNALATVLRTQRRYTEAISEYEATLAIDRNFVDALAALGRCKTYIGPVDDAISAQQQAIRLSPRDPALFNWYFRIGEAHLIQSRVDQAIEWLEKARSGTPGVWYVRTWLAAAYALKGNLTFARAEITEAKTLHGTRLEQGIAHIAQRFVAPEIRERFATTILAGLRRAGLSADDHP